MEASRIEPAVWLSFNLAESSLNSIGRWSVKLQHVVYISKQLVTQILKDI